MISDLCMSRTWTNFAAEMDNKEMDNKDKASILEDIFEYEFDWCDEIPTTGAEEASAESFPLDDASFLGSLTDSQTPLAAVDCTPNSR